MNLWGMLSYAYKFVFDLLACSCWLVTCDVFLVDACVVCNGTDKAKKKWFEMFFCLCLNK